MLYITIIQNIFMIWINKYIEENPIKIKLTTEETELIENFSLKKQCCKEDLPNEISVKVLKAAILMIFLVDFAVLGVCLEYFQVIVANRTYLLIVVILAIRNIFNIADIIKRDYKFLKLYSRIKKA